MTHWLITNSDTFPLNINLKFGTRLRHVILFCKKEQRLSDPILRNPFIDNEKKIEEKEKACLSISHLSF